jgi:uncharacterized protein (TIGR03118 family)
MFGIAAFLKEEFMRITARFCGMFALFGLVVLSLLCTSLPSAAASYKVTVLTSDQAGAPAQDPNLQNPWGLVASPTSPFWVSDNNDGLSTIYNGAGTPLALVVTIPGSGGGKGTPTGVVFNGTTDFVISGGPALFIFAGGDGTIAAWNASLGTSAEVAVDHSTFGVHYKGLELANNGTENLLYLTNFSAGRVDVFDTSFNQPSLSGNFTDPNLPVGYAPFNIASMNGRLYVTYAKQNASKTGAVLCAGCGFVDAYDFNGNLLKRVASGGTLNAPWGLALAPGSFGTFSGAVLIGNLGDGRISAFKSGKFLGQLLNSASKPITINSLRGLRFGNGGNAGLKKELFFTAGPGSYKHGRFGKITFQ